MLSEIHNFLQTRQKFISAELINITRDEDSGNYRVLAHADNGTAIHSVVVNACYLRPGGWVIVLVSDNFFKRSAKGPMPTSHSSKYEYPEGVAGNKAAEKKFRAAARREARRG